MKHVPVPPPRSTFTETADGVELVVPVRRHVGPLGHSRSYRRADVRALRAIDAPVTHMNPFQRGLPFGAPRLAFDYGSATIRFAADLDDAEARDIVRILDERGLVPVERNRHTP